MPTRSRSFTRIDTKRSCGELECHGDAGSESTSLSRWRCAASVSRMTNSRCIFIARSQRSDAGCGRRGGNDDSPPATLKIPHIWEKRQLNLTIKGCGNTVVASGRTESSSDRFTSPAKLDAKTEKPVKFKATQKEAYKIKVDDVTIDLRPLKTMLEQRLPPNHPLRVLVLGEPDFMPRSEYRSKLPGWFRILMNRAD